MTTTPAPVKRGRKSTEDKNVALIAALRAELTTAQNERDEYRKNADHWKELFTERDERAITASNEKNRAVNKVAALETDLEAVRSDRDRYEGMIQLLERLGTIPKQTF